MASNEYNQAQPRPQAQERVDTGTKMTQDATKAPTPAPAQVVEEKRAADQQRRKVSAGYGI